MQFDRLRQLSIKIHIGHLKIKPCHKPEVIGFATAEE